MREPWGIELILKVVVVLASVQGVQGYAKWGPPFSIYAVWGAPIFSLRAFKILWDFLYYCIFIIMITQKNLTFLQYVVINNMF